MFFFKQQKNKTFPDITSDTLLYQQMTIVTFHFIETIIESSYICTSK